MSPRLAPAEPRVKTARLSLGKEDNPVAVTVTITGSQYGDHKFEIANDGPIAFESGKVTLTWRGWKAVRSFIDAVIKEPTP